MDPRTFHTALQGVHVVRMPLASNIDIIAYVDTYYTIASTWILAVVNHLIIDWFKSCT
jgi:hypothetical protein